jgi:hypothetical protein
MPVIFLRSDLETALDALLSAGDFQGVGLHISHLGPGADAVAVGERHAEAAGELVRRLGRIVSSLNVTGDRSFDPFSSPESFEAAAATVSYWLRLGAAMGAPRVMMWDGITDDAESAPRRLADCISRGRELSGLEAPPPLTVELHPFTFALAHRRVGELAAALAETGDASFCWDFAHCAVALGRDFVRALPPDFLGSVGEVHYCDSDCTTSELHFPPGEGVLALDELDALVATHPVPLLWDLFSWPAPRDAVRRTMPRYLQALRRQREQLANGLDAADDYPGMEGVPNR